MNVLGWFLRRLPLGRRGERRAERFLRGLGYRILSHSFFCQLGEVDLICDDERTIVFVEVKTRTAALHGEPWEAVTADKQRRITRVAAYFVQRYRLQNRPVRFDVVAITWPADSASDPRIEHFIDAFPARGPWSL